MLSKGNETIVIETKANTSQLSKSQKLGGAKYLEKQLSEMSKGFNKGKGRWASYEDNEELGDAIDKLDDILKNKNKDFRICRVTLEDDPTGCYGKDDNGQCKGEVNCEKSWEAK